MSKTYQESSSAIYWIVGIIIASFLAIAFLIFQPTIQSTIHPKTNRELLSECTTDMATQFHIHPHLEIVINGQKQEIPTDIGIVDGCMSSIHTHDSTGKIHVESPEQRDFNLDDFFFIWGKAFSKDQILDAKADQTHVILITINGKESQDYEKTILRDNDQIVISYQEKQEPIE